MARIAVLGGSGDMGQHVVQDLIENTPHEVTIADKDEPTSQALANSLGDRAQALPVDATDPTELDQMLEGHDAAVGCIGPFHRFARPMAKAALRQGIPYVDLCDDHDAVPELLTLDENARKADTPLITGLGWTPGLTNLMAKKAHHEIGGASRIRIAWIGGAKDAQGRAVIEHTLHVLTGKVPSFEGGEPIQVPAATAPETVHFPEPFDPQKAVYCGHPEPLTLPENLEGVQSVTVKGSLTPAWNITLAKALIQAGATNTPARLKRTAGIVHKLESILGAGGHPASGARVDAWPKNAEEPSTGFTVVGRMGRLTGIPASIGADLLARGEITEAGVHAPEALLDPDAFFSALSKRGIEVNPAPR